MYHFSMTTSLAALLGDLETLGVDEKRRQEADYAELVINADRWGECTKRLTAALGAPTKPAGEKPTSDQERAAAPWGGVRKPQILFQGAWEGRPVVALVWPWDGGERYTLKLARPAA